MENLIQKKEENIQKLLKWSLGDFEEMLETYSKAKEVAIEKNDSTTKDILDEKISQLNEALVLKKQSPDASF